jgi:3-phenylpropionate/trans-cinnamate dioxygenase ferredoxin reductase component
VSGAGLTKKRIVIVGAGHAAAQLCASLVQLKCDASITLVGDEAALPYHRPPLSKTALDPKQELLAQSIRDADFYTSNSITTLTGRAVVSVDRSAKRVELEGEHCDYDALVLATGSLHRKPPIKGIDHVKVLSLRTIAEAGKLREQVAPGKTAAIIGGGFIGLEVAASLRKAGLEVTVVEMAPRVLSRVTCEGLSTYFAELHKSHGVDLKCGTGVAEIREDAAGKLEILDPQGRAVVVADFVVLGAGAAPNDALAKACGLETANGIVVDAHCRTSDASIFAIGDVANQLHPMYDARMRLESVQNATDQAKTVAAVLCDQPVPAPTLPWFWSDQYDVKLQIAGISTGHDQVVIRGEAKVGSSFSAWYLKQGRLLAVDAINDARSYILASKIIPRGARPPIEVIQDTKADLKPLLELKSS